MRTNPHRSAHHEGGATQSRAGTTVAGEPAPPELFEIFDDTGRRAGLAPRQQVHAAGLWHRSVHVFLFASPGALWIQQRAPDKDVCPGRWDLSVGEHLKPGENYHAAALRGLREELGVTGVRLRPLGETGRYRYDRPDLGIHDHELQRAFATTWQGTPTPERTEVAGIRAIDAVALGHWIARAPDDFTPWFLAELSNRPALGAFWLPNLLPQTSDRSEIA